MTAEAAPVVWVAEETPEAALALSQWASARGVRIVPPTAPLHSLAYSESEVVQIEQALARAREAVAQLDADGAERQLARAEQGLRAHPELPQAAWLMAEVQRGWAARYGRVEPRDDARAKRALGFADALDGGRAAGVGEAEPSKVVAVHVVFDAADPEVTWLLDARAVVPGKLDLPAGEHHLLAMSNGRVRFADWVTIVDGTKLSLAVQGRAACSADDLAHGTSENKGSSGVRCPVWVAASGAQKGVRASLCRGSSCEPAAYFPVSIPRWPPIDEPKRTGFSKKGIPAWLTWSIVGVTAAGAAVGILAATGIFAPGEHRTVFIQPGGVRPSTFRLP